MTEKTGGAGMARYLSQTDVWAIAFGCIIGWGAFVMPGTTFLPIAGPLGTLAAMAVSAAIMLVIGHNYSYLMIHRPGPGGVYSYTKEAFGRDHAFLCSWFLSLSYLSIAFREDELAAEKAGMQAHIAKPLDVDRMLKTLAEVIQEDRSRRNRR